MEFGTFISVFKSSRPMNFLGEHLCTFQRIRTRHQILRFYDPPYRICAKIFVCLYKHFLPNADETDKKKFKAHFKKCA